jgi:hypothetical protein
VSPLPPEIADIVRKLVAANRADLIIQVAEFRLTPFQAEAIVDRDERARKAVVGNPTPEKRNGKQRRNSGASNEAPDSGFSNEKPQKRRTPKHKAAAAEFPAVEKATSTNVDVEKRISKRKAVPAEPEKPRWDVKAMIA